MKNKKPVFYALIFFLIINSGYFWVEQIGFLTLLVWLILFLAFFVLLGFLLNQIFLLVGEKLANPKRLWLICLLSFVIGSAFYRPGGLIDFEGLKGAPILVCYT